MGKFYYGKEKSNRQQYYGNEPFLKTPKASAKKRRKFFLEKPREPPGIRAAERGR